MKRKATIDMILVFTFIWLKNLFINHSIFPWNDTVTIVISYAIDILVVLFFVVKVDKEPVSSIGIRSISPMDILSGFLLGIILYLVQILPPVIFMHMDISGFTAPPQWLPLFFRFLFLLVTVGIGEELVFRGFLLHKLERLVSSKVIAVLFSCVLFYVFHLTKAFVFDWTQVYSTFATTILLSTYWYKSKKRSIFPLIIAHAMLDLLLGAPGFYLINIFWR